MVSFQPESGVGDTTPTPFYIFSGDDDSVVDLVPIKRAKAALDLDVKIVPRKITLDHRPVDTFNYRVLAIGLRPTWLCHYALITEKTSDAGWQRAVKWVITGEPDPKATMVLDTLNSILGPGVREISEEELESERRMRAYLNRED